MYKENSSKYVINNFDTGREDDENDNMLVILNCYILIPLCIFGFFSNILALILFNRHRNIGSGTSVYLNNILLLDVFQLLGTAVMTIPYFCDKAYDDNGHVLHKFCLFYYRYIGLIMSKLIAVADTAQVWSLTVLSVHRYWKISKPMKALVSDTPKRALKIIFILFIAVILFRIPVFFELRLANHNYLNVSVIIENVPFARNRQYGIIYYLILNTIFYNIIPFTILSIMSVLTLKSIIEARRCGRNLNTNTGSTTIRHNLSPKRKLGEIKSTISICFMTILFLVFHSLFVYEIVQRYRSYIHNDVSQNFLLISDVNTILSMLNSTLNAFVYIAFINKCKEYLVFKFKTKDFRMRSRTLSSLMEYAQTSSSDGDNENLVRKPCRIKKCYSSATVRSTEF